MLTNFALKKNKQTITQLFGFRNKSGQTKTLQYRHEGHWPFRAQLDKCMILTHAMHFSKTTCFLKSKCVNTLGAMIKHDAFEICAIKN